MCVCVCVCVHARSYLCVCVGVFEMAQIEDCLKMLEKRELDPAHCNLWRLPVGTKLVHFVKDNQVCVCVRARVL